MIYYDYMYEQWEDDKNPLWSVPMTPEGGPEETDKTFNTREEFYLWYYDGNEALARAMVDKVDPTILNDMKCTTSSDNMVVFER